MKKRLILYPALLLSALVLIGLFDFDFQRSACIRTLNIPKVWGESIMSPDGHLIASIEAAGRTTVTRVDGSERIPFLTDDFPVEMPSSDNPRINLGFSGQSAHLFLHNATGFRAIDLETKLAVDFRLPPAAQPANADTEEPQENLQERVQLQPVDDTSGELESDDLFRGPPDEATGKIEDVFLSATARYAVLKFSQSERVALLERGPDGYAFRRWIEVKGAAYCRFVFAGDDSMAVIATGSDIQACAFPSGKHFRPCEDIYLRYMGSAVVTSHPTKALFAFVGLDLDGDGISAVRWYDGAARSMSEQIYGKPSARGISHVRATNDAILYPTFAIDRPLENLGLVERNAVRDDSYSLRHDLKFKNTALGYYLGSGLGPEGRLLRVATGKPGQNTFAIDTFDLDLVDELKESRRRSYSRRIQLGLFGGVVLLCLVFEGSLVLARKREERERQLGSRFFSACEEGNHEAVAKLLRGRARKALVRERNNRGFTPLLIAAGLGRAETVEALLAAGADIEASDPVEQGTALTYACCSKDGGATALVLIRHGANLRAATKRGIAAAKLAAERGWTEVLAAIAEKDPAALALPNQEGVTPAYSAAEDGHTACLELCARHAPASFKVCRTEDHASPAYVAAFKGHDAALEVIARTAPEVLHLPGPSGYLPATIAAQKGHVACVRVLASHAPDTFAITVEAEKKITPALLASQNGHHEALELIAGVAPATLGQPRATDNVTPAYQAAFNGHHRCLEVIGLHAPDSLRTRNAEQHLPAFVAAQNDHVACLEVLHRIAPDTLADPIGGTPAFIAAQLNKLEALRYLLKVAPESFDLLLSGNSPAHVAAVLGHDEAYALIAAGGPGLLAMENLAGKTPAMLREAGIAERKAKAEQEKKETSKSLSALGGVVVWGIGFRADQGMLHTAATTVAQGNPIRAIMLFGLPSEVSRLDEKPSEVEAIMYYQRIARRNGWNTTITPKFQFLGLQDGRKLLMAYPPIV